MTNPPFDLPCRVISLAGPRLRVALAVLLGLPIAAASAGTFTWNNTTGSWSEAARWGGTAPTGANVTDILVFGGDVGTLAGTAPNYEATEDLAGTPFVLNRMTFNATDVNGLGVDQTLVAGVGAKGVRFAANGATGPAITQNGVGGITLDLPLELAANLTLGGSGSGEVTMNHAVTGVADVVKNGASTFRFGTPFNSTTLPTTGPSANTWVGKLTINDGIIRFNNNANSGRTALRANAVVLNAATAQLTASSEIRAGTLSGSAGNVQTLVTSPNANSESIVLHALSDGDFGGTVRIDPKMGSGKSEGILTVRGTGTQTLSGTVSLNVVGGDMSVGRGATLVFAGNAALDTGTNTRGAVVLNGGTFKLDNLTNAISDRLRDGTVDQTGLDTIGGGTFSFIGNAAGSTETLGRLQLGSVNNGTTVSTPRSGALTVNVTRTSVVAPTVLTFQSYTRDARNAGFNQTTTANFLATAAAGGALSLGATGVSGRVSFGNFTVPLLNGLLTNTSVGVGIPVGRHDVGWATVTTAAGLDFATYSTAFETGFVRGVVALGSATVLPGGTGNAATNVKLAGNGTISSASAYSLSSLRIVPGAAAQNLDITDAGHLTTTAMILSNDPTLGALDYTIRNNGGGTGGIAGDGPRYFHVQAAVLTVGVSLAGADQPVVKAGAGALVLTSSANAAGVTQPVVINAGTLRATPGTSLPSGELRLRGGVLEITGGGTFNRTIGGNSTGTATNTVNWSGITAANASIPEDRGSGGFAAVGADVSIDLNTLGGADLLAWEDKGFINSGHALVFGSTRATHRVTWTDNLVLNAVDPTVNYNAREVRVMDNLSVSTDSARISGVISGTLQNDLLKTGGGTLELTGPNTYLGNTILQEGVLSISAAAHLGATTGANTLVFHGGTLRTTAAGVALAANRTVSIGAPGGTMDVTTGADLTVTGDITGAGATLTKTGAGTLNLNGAQNYGTLTASGGTTNVNGSLGSGGASVQVNGGAALKFGSVSQNLAGLTIGAGATVTFTSGPQNFTKNDGGSQTLTGFLNYASLTTTAGVLNVNGGIGAGTSTVTVNNLGTRLNFGSVSQTLASLTIGAGATVTFTSGVAAFSGGEGKPPGVAAVPEPSSALLAALGAALLGLRRRRAVTFR